MQRQLMTFIQRRGDEALATAITALLLADILVRDAPAASKLAMGAVAVVLGVAAARRVRAPLVFLGLLLVVTVAAVVLPNALPQTQGSVASGSVLLYLLLAVYSAAAHTSGREMVLAGATTVGFYVIDLVAIDPAGINPEGIVFYALLYGAPWVAGRAVRSRRLKDRQLEHEKARAAAAIVEERARIARELHDVVAHSISVMVLQARGGRRVLDSEPADARDAFATIERTGQQALDEMRRLLGMLRRSDEALALTPQPSLSELGRLVEQVGARWTAGQRGRRG